MAFKLSNMVLNEIYSIKVFMVRVKFVYLHESLKQELVESSPAPSVYSREHFLKNFQREREIFQPLYT